MNHLLMIFANHRKILNLCVHIYDVKKNVYNHKIEEMIQMFDSSEINAFRLILRKYREQNLIVG